MPADDPTSELEALRNEVARLRAVVGPSETAYDDLQADLFAARDAAKGAEAAAGTLRGLNAELHLQLARARQDQDHVQRMLGVTFTGIVARAIRAVRVRVF